jgi:transposase
MRVAPNIILTPEERRQLVKWSRGRSAPHRLVLRSRIVVLSADGKTNKEIVEELKTNPVTVGRWRSRFALLRIDGISKDAPRPGRKPRIPASIVKKILDVTLHEKPPGETHWSTRTLAEKLDVSHMTVQRVWKAHNLQPHRVRSFKLSRDPRFEEKLVDVVGLYMNPPEKAVVFSFDEKPQTQALERKQAILPMGQDFPEGYPHDYRRNGTVDLFVALNILDGTVVTQFHNQHRHQEFLSFLRVLDGTVPSGVDIHVVLDNLSAHIDDAVDRWMKRHPRFRFHFTPTGSSWLNLVESWLSNLTKKRLRRGSFSSVPALKKAVEEFVEAYNSRAKPFVWTKDADEILRKVRKIQHMLAESQQGNHN